MTGTRLPNFEASRAVLIGVSVYQDESLPNLPAVAENLVGLRTVLTDPGLSGFSDGAVTVVADPADPGAVMTPIMEAVTEATDLVLVYFAGHGLVTGEAGELHLATGRTVPGQPWTSLPFRYLAGLLRGGPSLAKVLLLDCCYSGRAARDLMGDPTQLAVDQVAVDGVYVMTSTSGTRTAKAPAGHRFTAFTGGFLDVVRCGLPSGDELLDMGRIFDVVRARMRRAGWPIPEQFHHNNAGNLALARNRPTRLPGPLPAADGRRPGRTVAAGRSSRLAERIT